MTLKQLPHDFAVAKLASAAAIGGLDLAQPYTFLSVTDDEVSLVCPAQRVPGDATAVEAPWAALKIASVLDFSLVGIIAKVSGLLADKHIPVFVVSTYDTDYVLVKRDRYPEAADALKGGGYEVVD